MTHAGCSGANLTGVEVPKGYIILPIVGSITGERNDSSYDAYDLAVQQRTFYYFKISHSKSNATSTIGTNLPTAGNNILCAAPSDIFTGSREPEADFPPSIANALRVTKAMVSALLISYTVAVVTVV